MNRISNFLIGIGILGILAPLLEISLVGLDSYEQNLFVGLGALGFGVFLKYAANSESRNQ
jgi:hypothetical protein